MSQVSTAPFLLDTETQSSRLRVAHILGGAIYVSLLALIALTAIPYGTVEAWWKAVFICLVFALCVLWIIEGTLSGSWRIRGLPMLTPLFALAAFSLLQTVPLGPQAAPGISYSVWNAISADPFATRFFVLQLLALTLAAALLYCYVSNERRMSTLIHVIIAVAVASAIFGMLRQTTQHSLGFGLPLIKPDQGYGQFINRNHFAFLMEMGFGLPLGMIAGAGVKRERALILFASLLPVWTALVLSNSRGGLVAIMAQLIAGALLFAVVIPRSNSEGSKLRIFRIARLWPVRGLLLLVFLLLTFLGTIWMGGDRLATRVEQTRAELDPAMAESRQGASRNEIWRATWKMFTAHPIAGVGLGGYWAAIPTYHEASGLQTPQEAHNDYLELLASGGLIGLAIGGWFMIVVFRRIRDNLKSASPFRRAACFGALLGIVGVAVHSLFDFGLHMIVNALVFAALVMIATNREDNENKSRTI